MSEERSIHDNANMAPEDAWPDDPPRCARCGQPMSEHIDTGGGYPLACRVPGPHGKIMNYEGT